MNKKFVKFLSILLLVLVLSSSIPTFAATFPDVTSKHWAYDHIEKMVKLKMINGYDDGKFKPSDTVNYLENLKLISGLITLTPEELYAGKMAYNSLITELKIPDWAHEAVIKSLYKGVISEAELKEAQSKGLTTIGTKLRPQRLTIAVYLAKAMGLEELASSKPVIVLPYKEVLDIDRKYHKYLSVLLDAGVLNSEGTGGGYFEPKSSVQRDAMAKMLSTAYDYLKRSPVKPIEPVKPVEILNIRGTVMSIYSDNVKSYILVKDRSNIEKTYIVDSKTKITIDTKVGVVASIFKGQDIELTAIKDDLTIITLNVSSIEERIKGIVKSIATSTNKITIEYTKDRVITLIELLVDKNASIYVNDKKGDLYDIKAGDSLDLVTRNNVILEIDAKSKLRKVEGIISSIKETSRIYTLTIEDSKGVKVDYELSDKAYIYRDNKIVKVTDLRVGDNAYISLEYNIILEIDTKVIKKELKGYIAGINRRLNKSAEITIKNRDSDKEEVYEIGQNAYIRVDNVVVTSLDLRVGYFVDIVIGGNEIIEIYADSIASESMIRGKIKDVNIKYSEVEIEVTSSDLASIKYGDKVLIRPAKDVIISDGKYINLILNDIKIGMNVYIFGTYDGSVFIATEINIR